MHEFADDERLKYQVAYNDFCRHHGEVVSFEEFICSNPFKDRTFFEAALEVKRLGKAVAPGLHQGSDDDR